MSYRLFIAPKVEIRPGAFASKVAAYIAPDGTQIFPHVSVLSSARSLALVLVASASDDFTALISDSEILDPFQRSFTADQRRLLAAVTLGQIITNGQANQIKNWMETRGFNLTGVTLEWTLRQFFKHIADQLSEAGYELEGNWCSGG